MRVMFVITNGFPSNLSFFVKASMEKLVARFIIYSSEGKFDLDNGSELYLVNMNSRTFSLFVETVEAYCAAFRQLLH